MTTLASPVREGAIALPVRFSAHRFIATPVTTTEQTLNLYTDTGGGLFMTKTAVDKLAWPARAGQDDNGKPFRVIDLPAFRKDHWIPGLGQHGVGMRVRDDSWQQEDEGLDGMLGQAWFAGRTWTFDYAEGQLWFYTGKPLDVPLQQRVTLGFLRNMSGQAVCGFPRISVHIDGVMFDMLFDTGALVQLSDRALNDIDDGLPAVRAASFITSEWFDIWRAKHPEWRVLECADAGFHGADMIEVPRLNVAGHEVGPVWFSERPTRNLHQGVSRMMDRQVDGALGGSALRFFRVTVDYERAFAVFEPV